MSWWRDMMESDSGWRHGRTNRPDQKRVQTTVTITNCGIQQIHKRFGPARVEQEQHPDHRMSPFLQTTVEAESAKGTAALNCSGVVSRQMFGDRQLDAPQSSQCELHAMWSNTSDATYGRKYCPKTLSEGQSLCWLH